MKAFDRAACAMLAIAAALILLTNIMLSGGNGNNGRQYRVDASRAAAALENGSFDIADYPSLVSATKIESEGDLLGGKEDYLIMSAGGELYRFDYRSDGVLLPLTKINICLGGMAALLAATLILIRFRILKPFFQLREVPYELSRGNLSMTVKENRHKLFGRFAWGINLLRDNLEQNKKHELELLAEKKRLIISLSHDIKIPLSAIKLYAKGMEKGLYHGEELARAAGAVNERAGEIERYVSEIVKASNEDFLSLEVQEGEFYLSEAINKIKLYYSEKLALTGTAFKTEKYTDCLIRGDCDRAAEVLQNIIENAVKYGDGKSISVSFSDEEDCRLVTVKNTGSSLPEDQLPHVFDSFFRGSNSSGKSGSGLGLYICRTLMRRMDGDIFAGQKDGVFEVTAVFRRA